MDLRAIFSSNRRAPLLLLLWAAAASSSTLTTSDHSLTEAYSGTNVTLSCKAPPGSDLENLGLEWTRADLQESYYVFLFRDGRPYLTYQHFQFEGRVELNDPTLRSGDLSIKLHSVEQQDNGRYQCHIFSKSHVRKRSVFNTEPIKTIDLTVKEQHSLIPAFSGTTVTLPCKAPHGSDLENLILEWTRPGLQESHVFLFRDGRLVLDNQDSQFKGRVELDDPTFQSGDLSIKLHDIGQQDSGRYECHVFSQSHAGKQSGFKTEPIKTIDLTVKEPEYIEAFPGQDVVFPLDNPDFKVTSVMWKREDDPERFVYIWGMDPPHHQNPQYSGRTALLNQDQSDLSMILRRVQPSDSGTYHGYIIQSQHRTKRQLDQELDRVIIFKVLTSGALRLEGGAAFVIPVLISMLLKILE